ncbi:MAG: hypothetical protein HZC26_04215 [Candidatus Magasanikbacteria bacterium]|nr:hypothetical protein [Candidatus Magasanikbacteria bacterium]
MGAIYKFPVPQRLLDGRHVRAIAIIGGKAQAEVSSGTYTLYVPLIGIQPAADSAQRVLFSEVATRLRNPQ